MLVTARTSSFYFRDKDVTIAEFGRILGVQALLEGSIQIVNDQLRVAFEWLYKAATTGPQVSQAAVHPLLVKLHDDPRWLPFLESIGKSPGQLAGVLLTNQP